MKRKDLLGVVASRKRNIMGYAFLEKQREREREREQRIKKESEK